MDWKEQLSEIRGKLDKEPKDPKSAPEIKVNDEIITNVDLDQPNRTTNIKNVLQKLEIEHVFHMTHIDNLRDILNKGLLPHNNPYKKVDISNIPVNDRRNRIEHIYGKNLHDYVPFYFNPRNAMQYKAIKQFGKNIIILVFDADIITEHGVIITNKNAATDNVIFTNDIEKLLDGTYLNWKDVYSLTWNNYGNPDEKLKQTMMAEVLIPEKVYANKIKHICCQADYMKEFIENCYDIENIESVIKCNNTIFF
ncbi:hypothetical protein CCP3SC5AM1_2270006 [Gammaproteobacteria bacterium]